MNLVIAFILGLAAVVIVALRLLIPRRHFPSAPGPVALGGGLLVLVGTILAIIAFARVDQAMAWQKRPTVRGVVTRAIVTGESSFAPEIDYSFTVDSVTYTGSSDRHVPLFGNRRRTLEVAEKEVATFEPGTPVTVYYNPRNPEENTIQPEPRWNDLAQTGLGVFLFAGGLFMLLLPRKKPATVAA